MLLSVSKNNLPFSILFTLVYFLLSLTGIIYHEIWLDEAHSFLIARDSHSFFDLLQNTRQEGHPHLWYLILWTLTKFSHEVFYMQLLHIILTSTGIFLLFYFSKITNLKKILFAFSYFLFYEYNIISRNYGICFLLVTIFCVLISAENKNFLLASFVLALLANSHFIALLLSVPLSAVMFILMSYDKQYKGKWVIPAVILLIAYAICLKQVIPPEDSYFATLPRSDFFSMKRWGTFSSLFKAFYQFPNLLSNEGFWNTNIFTSNKIIGLIAILLFPVLLVKSFANKPFSLMVLFASWIGISMFFFTELMHNYTVRHWGLIFLGFYVACWLENGIDQQTLTTFLQKRIPFVFIKENIVLKNSIIYSALTVQVIASIVIYSKDLTNAFSNGINVAQYIKANHYENDLIILSNFTSGPPVSAYLDKKLFYPEYNKMGSFGIWNTRPWRIDSAAVLKRISSLKNIDRAILVMDGKEFNPTGQTDYKETILETDRIKIQYLTRFEGAILRRENFELYMVSYK